MTNDLRRREFLGAAGLMAAFAGAGSAAAATGGDAQGVPARAMLTITLDLDPSAAAGGGAPVPILGGRFEGRAASGERISGEVLPGGADWRGLYAGGLQSAEARYTLRARDGALIQAHHHGLVAPGAPGPAPATPDFVAPEGVHDWLNGARLVGAVEIPADAPHRRIVSVFAA